MPLLQEKYALVEDSGDAKNYLFVPERRRKPQPTGQPQHGRERRTNQEREPVRARSRKSKKISHALNVDLPAVLLLAGAD